MSDRGKSRKETRSARSRKLRHGLAVDDTRHASPPISKPKNMKDFVGPTLPYPSAFDDSKPTIVPHKSVVEVSLKIAKLADEYPDAFYMAIRDNYWAEISLEVLREGGLVRGKRLKVTTHHKVRLVAEWLHRPKGTSWDDFCVQVAAAGWGPWSTAEQGEKGRSAVSRALQEALDVYRGMPLPEGHPERGWEATNSMLFRMGVKNYSRSNGLG